MKRIFYIIIIFFTFLDMSFGANDLTIDVDNTENKKISIIFEKVGFIDSKNTNNVLVEKILKTVKNDLSTTGLFSVQDSANNIYKNFNEVNQLSNSEFTNFVISKYFETNIDAVLIGYIEMNSENKMELKIRFWDILDQRELFAKYYVIDDNNWKRIGDIIADNIYESLTGEVSGHFDSKIMFVSETGKVKDRKRRIAMADFDGSNLQYITNGDNIVLTPVFSKFNKNEIIYLEYKNKKPHLYKFDLNTGDLIFIGNSMEMTYAPNFNPNGLNEIVFSATEDGLSNIYRLNFDTKKITKLTFDKAISTVPSFSPDGEKIVFVSDKIGVRKLYVMGREGDNIQMISSGRGVYDKPSWSPDGKLISFVKLDKGEFSIGLMTPKGESERIIMSAYLIEGIKWSPNGRYLIYTKQIGPFGKDSIPGIYTIDILTGIEYKIPTPANQGASDPDWIKK